jgi:hypothetical protein
MSLDIRLVWESAFKRKRCWNRVHILKELIHLPPMAVRTDRLATGKENVPEIMTFPICRKYFRRKSLPIMGKRESLQIAFPSLLNLTRGGLLLPYLSPRREGEFLENIFCKV